VDRAEGEDIALKTTSAFKFTLVVTVAGMLIMGILAAPWYNLSTLAAQTLR